MRTYKTEKRVIKKARKNLQAKRSMQHEAYLQQMLTKEKVSLLIKKVLETEAICHGGRKRKIKEDSKQEPKLSTMATIEGDTKKHFRRILSAGEMELISGEEANFAEGRSSCATQISDQPGPREGKKDKFYIYFDSSAEAMYLEQEDSLLLKEKDIRHLGTLAPNKLPQIIMPSDKRIQQKERLNIQRENQDPLSFNFKEYTSRIAKCWRYL